MTELAMKLRLSSRASENLAARAASSGQDVAAVASELIEQAFTSPATTEMPYEQWAAEFQAWVSSHKPVGHFVDDSRESIYDGRGE
jgi:hypothetical protein